MDSKRSGQWVWVPHETRVSFHHKDDAWNEFLCHKCLEQEEEEWQALIQKHHKSKKQQEGVKKVEYEYIREETASFSQTMSTANPSLPLKKRKKPQVVPPRSTAEKCQKTDKVDKDKVDNQNDNEEVKMMEKGTNMEEEVKKEVEIGEAVDAKPDMQCFELMVESSKVEDVKSILATALGEVALAQAKAKSEAKPPRPKPTTSSSS